MQQLCLLVDGGKSPTTIDLASVLLALRPLLWSIRHFPSENEMWKRGADEFNANRISRIKSHLRDGGELRIGTDDSDLRNTAVIIQGDMEHHRTHTNGCILSMKTTGDGDMDLIQQMNLDKQVFLSRNGEVHDGGLPTVKKYRYVRKVTEMAVADPDTTPGLFQQAMGVAESSTWIGLIALYFEKVPGPMSVKVPMTLFLLSVVSRADGSGALAPMMIIVRTVWIVLRSTVDFATGSGGGADGWYWAFTASLTWPGFVIMKNVWRRVLVRSAPLLGETHIVEECQEPAPTMPSLLSRAATHTASDSVASRESCGDTVTGPCNASGVLIQKKRDQPLAASVCRNSTVHWCWVNNSDGRCAVRGETNRFDGQEWVKLRDEHSEKYEEWLLAQQCAVRGCASLQSGTVIDGIRSTFCIQHTSTGAESARNRPPPTLKMINASYHIRRRNLNMWRREMGMLWEGS